MPLSMSWRTISEEDYRATFDSFGGSFPVHPRVVSLVAELSKRPVRYCGLISGGAIVAAAPLWGDRIVATESALTFHDSTDLVDIGESEVVLPVAADIRISLPFVGGPISNLHEANIVNLTRETAYDLTLLKSLRSGTQRLSGKSQTKRRRELRSVVEAGGCFRGIEGFSPKEVAAIYADLHGKRWGCPPLGHALLPTVLRELRDMLCGDMLFVDDRPVAMDLTYRHETPRWIFANGVQGGIDPAYRHLSPGSTLLFHNLGRFEEEANAVSKPLRYCLGTSLDTYKAQWTYAIPVFRVGPRPV